jgi:lysophospholipase L1-like esterase
VLLAAAVAVAWTVSASRAFHTVDLTGSDVAGPRSDAGERTARPGIVALLGDSWVAHDKLTQAVLDELGKRGVKDIAVRSFGQPGATSRQVLDNLLEPETAENSSAEVLADKRVRFAVVIVGVNDSIGHRGADFYVHHVLQIVGVLRNRGIQSLVLELPEYGIQQIHDARGFARWLKHEFFIQVFDGGKTDVIADYRAALREALDAAGLRDEVVVIDFESIVSSYDEQSDLFRDPAHLNEAGQQRLAHTIAAAVVARIGADRRGAMSATSFREMRLDRDIGAERSTTVAP